MVSCGEKTPVVELFSLEIKDTEVSADAGSQFVSVEAVGDWTLQIEGNPGWAKLTRTSGSGNSSSIVLSYTANTALEARTLALVLTGGGQSLRTDFKQLGKIMGTQTGLNPDKVTAWLELPAMAEGDGRYFFTHDMRIDDYHDRNYSFYFDEKSKISVWVAYPLNRVLEGPQDIRPEQDPWHLDEKLPASSYQCNVVGHSFNGYQRGHQIPSRDRCANAESNFDTFAMTNVTPQLKVLNEGAWQTLEHYVRDWSHSFDTLYVVTGADINTAKGTIADNDGKRIVIPGGYFKALLGYKKKGGIGNTSSTGGYTAIGFYMKHEECDKNDIMKYAMTIDELEQKTGFDFFVNLPSKIGDKLSDKVESTKDSWWY